MMGGGNRDWNNQGVRNNNNESKGRKEEISCISQVTSLVGTFSTSHLQSLLISSGHQEYKVDYGQPGSRDSAFSSVASNLLGSKTCLARPEIISILEAGLSSRTKSLSPQKPKEVNIT